MQPRQRHEPRCQGQEQTRQGVSKKHVRQVDGYQFCILRRIGTALQGHSTQDNRREVH